MKSYKAYYINLDKSTDRKNFMEKQFKELNIPLTRFPGIYGKELDNELLKKTKQKHHLLTHYPLPNDGEIGLTLTYFSIWKKIARQDEDFAIVLEDDALVTKEFFTDLKNILNELSLDDFVDISGRKGVLNYDDNEYTNTFVIPPLQTTGQIIGKEAAKKLYSNLDHYYSPIDVMIQDIFKHKVKINVAKKQYVSSNDKNIGGSTIQKNRMHISKKIIREIFRPIWQLTSLLTYKPFRFIKNEVFGFFSFF